MLHCHIVLITIFIIKIVKGKSLFSYLEPSWSSEKIMLLFSSVLTNFCQYLPCLIILIFAKEILYLSAITFLDFKTTHPSKFKFPFIILNLSSFLFLFILADDLLSFLKSTKEPSFSLLLYMFLYNSSSKCLHQEL